MERITKTLSLEGWVAEAIQELANKEKRSFTRQAEVLLEAALGRSNQPDLTAEAQGGRREGGRRPHAKSS